MPPLGIACDGALWGSCVALSVNRGGGGGGDYLPHSATDNHLTAPL